MTPRLASNTMIENGGRYTNIETNTHNSSQSASKLCQQDNFKAHTDREKNWLDRKHSVSQYKIIQS
jgi:hypothetical protein